MKLVVEEPESAALREFLAAWPERVSSVLAAVETARAARRKGGARAFDRAIEILRDISALDVDGHVINSARTVDPPELGTLDAIHLATGLSISDGLGGFVTYDAGLASAAATAGLTVLAPR